ncbi:MAG TPA: hypothetical protein VMJ34_14070 [Bryobacteraceae bacterium]|nr:hypothetical protein [Bryobacteraceae bacterium]
MRQNYEGTAHAERRNHGLEDQWLGEPTQLGKARAVEARGQIEDECSGGGGIGKSADGGFTLSGAKGMARKPDFMSPSFISRPRCFHPFLW